MSGIPQVEMAAVDGFAKVWKHGSIALIIDPTTKQFALDFANTALKSYFMDLAQKAMAKKKAAEEAEKPSIILEG